ncbi:MAG: acyl-CoA dehydrogenase family protein [Bacillota bacterium]
MDFHLSEAHKVYQAEVQKFVQEEVLPVIGPYRKESVFPEKIFKSMGARGMLRAFLPVEYGGANLGALGFCLLSEELGKADAGLTHNGHFQTIKMLMQYGTREQQGKYLEKLLSGEYLAGAAISEPTVGSSFDGMQTKAVEDDGYYTVSGVKTHINDAAEADVLSLFARTEQGVTIFLLDKGTPGFEILKKIDPIGFRTSPLYNFKLKDCRLPAAQILGEAGQGVQVFFTGFNFSRLGNASVLLGIAKAAFRGALEFAQKREVGSRKVTEFQGIRWMLAEMFTRIESAELIRNKAAIVEDEGGNGALYSSMAKLLCAEVATDVASAAIEITASRGCDREFPFEHYLSDAKAVSIGGGTLEVMKNNIARQIIFN